MGDLFSPVTAASDEIYALSQAARRKINAGLAAATDYYGSAKAATESAITTAAQYEASTGNAIASTAAGAYHAVGNAIESVGTYAKWALALVALAIIAYAIMSATNFKRSFL